MGLSIGLGCEVGYVICLFVGICLSVCLTRYEIPHAARLERRFRGFSPLGKKEGEREGEQERERERERKKKAGRGRAI